MARTSIATDDFNRASLGTDWAQLNATWNSVSISGNAGQVTNTHALASGREGAARWVGAGTFTDDQYASVTIPTVSWLGAECYVGVLVRASADIDANRDYYGVVVRMDSAGDKTTELFKVVNGTFTSLHSATVAWANGDRVELEVEGTTLRVCKNGTALGGSFTQTDTSIASGAPGFVGAGTVKGDDWVGGNLTSGASAVPAIASFYQMLRSA